MRIYRRLVAGLLVALMIPTTAFAQAVDPAETWRVFAEKVEPGAELKVRLHNGQRFRASLVRTTPDALVLLPKTRLPVDVQAVRYAEIVSLERDERGGIGAGKAIAIGVASGVGAFLGMLLILFAAIDD